MRHKRRMKMHKVLMTRKLPEPALDYLRSIPVDLHIYSNERNMPTAEILEAIPEYDGLICLLNDPIDRRILEKGRKLKGICNYAAGTDNIDLAAAAELKIPVCNTPGVLSDATAELAWALLFAAARHIPASHEFVRENRFKGWAPDLFLGREIQGKTLGIIGAGRIGTAMALKSRGFDMKVLYTRSPNAVIDHACDAECVPLDRLLRESDFISIHTPLTPQTRHLITARELQMMKKDAILINTGRGPVIREADLLTALQNRQIHAAALDVYEFEPKLTEGLISLDNVILSPHTGSATIEAREKMAMMSARDMKALLSGETPAYPVKLPSGPK